MRFGINKKEKTDIIHELCITDAGCTFATSIDEALAQAEAELTELKETVDSIKALHPDCDKLDYILAASSGAICGVIDIFLVGKPGESPIGNLTDQWFAARTMDFAKLCHPDKKDFDSLESALRFLEKKFKVPYDQTGLGDAGSIVFDLNAKNHHFKSLAHNPSLLGLFFSILDQFTNTSHFVTKGQLISLQQADEGWELRGKNIPGKLFCGFVNWFGHLVSDVSGSQSSARAGNRGMGIPSPLWTWINDVIVIKTKLGLKVTDTDKAMNELALKIFEQGYDARFQTAQAIPVILNDLIVRFVYALRRLFGYFMETPKSEYSFRMIWKKCEPFSNPTVKRMLMVAHGTFCLVDVGDAVGRAFVAGGGTFQPVEFALRLNIVGVGRFTISLYGEAKNGILYHQKKQEADFALKCSVIIQDYSKNLKILYKKYDDAAFLKFDEDFQNPASSYGEGLKKTAQLAELRGVPKEKILKNKLDTDKHFVRKRI